jgi:hypothetical protein
VVGVSHRGGTCVSAVAIDGVNAMARGQPLTLPGGQSQQFFYVTGHIGSTADIDVTLSGSSSRCGVHVWTLSGADMSGASVSTASNGASGSTLATTVEVGADSVVLGLMTTITPSSPAITWGGLTERHVWSDYGDTYGAGTADQSFADAAMAHPISATGGGSYNALSVLSIPAL